ncbi:MAG: DUF1059 domain-containing protein [Patescibacteria group bacterium]
MFTIACKDLGVECPHVSTGETKEAALAAGMAHVKEVHMADPKVMEMMTMPEDKMMELGMSMVKEG